MRNLLIPLVLLFCCAYSCEPPVEVEKRSILEMKIDSLLSRMTLEEKIGQTAQRGTSSRVKELPEELLQAVRAGRVGSMINVTDRDLKDQLQKVAVEESPNGIPLIFGRDVIHGYKTIFPIPLAQAASWSPETVEEGARIAAAEASTNGIHWTFAPMIDISRDPRWGRIAESAGEDPYLTSVMAKAYVRGFQGADLAATHTIAACAKHFAAYGAAEGGRDYNTANVPENLLREVYLPPFRAAVEAGAATFMSSFNDINGVPATGNKWLLDKVLRQEWGFNGFVVSDWNSVTEMISHGYCADDRDAALKAANAGLDMEMMSTAYENHLKSLIEEGKVSIAQLDRMVRNILRVKYKLGLFEHPYTDRSRDSVVLSAEHLSAAKTAAVKSMVLLKNENVLPLDPGKNVAVIGPLADAPHEQLGTWIFDGNKKDSKTPLDALKDHLGEGTVKFAAGLEYSRDKSRKSFSKTVALARVSDVILFFAGEESILSGEAHSRADISLPGAQEDLIIELSKTGKPLVLVVLAGRPITFERILDKVDAILFAWHPGTMGGPAVVDLLYGVENPSGRLPVTWPKSSGQIPVYYNHRNTGRPASQESFVQLDDIPIEAWQSSLGNNSHYLDLGFEPLYPFGFGLSYTTFSYSDIQISSKEISRTDTLLISATITNTGEVAGEEVVQLYIRDLVADVVRPVRELKGFQRIALQPGEQKKVSFSLTANALGFYNQEMKYVSEPGAFDIWIGPNALEGLKASFSLK